MAKSKYCYVIVRKENGTMLLEDGKLPFYWNKNVAINRCNTVGGFTANKWVVHKLLLTELQAMILNSKKAI